MNSIDPLQLQRLVDGELDLQQIQALLQDAESTPEYWREIATSLIEDRLFCQTMAQSPASTAAVELNSQVPPAATEDPIVSDSVVRSKTTHAHSDQRNSVFHWMLLAACMLVAMGVGYSLNFNSVGSAPIVESTSSDDAVEPVTNSLAKVDSIPGIDPNAQITPAVFQPDYHLEVPESRGILSRENVGPISPVPLYSVRNAQQLREFRRKQFTSNRIAPELVQQMSNAGFHVKQDIEFISGNVGKGKRFYVPVRTTRFMPRQ